MTARPMRERTSVDMIAAAWGGLVASVGLMVGVEADIAVRLVAIVVAFVVGGFLAGVRASDHRRLHGVVAAVLGYVIFVVFVAVAWVVSTWVGPDPPSLAPDGALVALVGVGAALVCAFFGAALADRWLRPSRKRASSP